MDKLGRRTLFFLSLALLLHLGLLFWMKGHSSSPLRVSLSSHDISTELSFYSIEDSIQAPKNPQKGLARKKQRAERPQKKEPSQAELEAPLPTKDHQATGRPNEATDPNQKNEKMGALKGQAIGKSIKGKDDELKKYIRKVVVIINRRKRYPRLSQENGEQGKLMIKLVIGKSGDLLSYNLVKKSPFERLNQATVLTVPQTVPKSPTRGLTMAIAPEGLEVAF